MTDEWLDTPDDDGITLGPEEALGREISKSKALKVERLKLKDRVEQLTAQNKSLRDENDALKQKPKSSPGNREPSPHTSNSKPPQRSKPFLPNRWAFILLAFNLAAIGILLLFLLQRPAS